MTYNKRTNWKTHLQKARQIARYGASIEAAAIEARLQAQLPQAVWGEVEARWEEMDDVVAYLPEQRLSYLIRVAGEHEVSLAGIENWGGW